MFVVVLLWKGSANKQERKLMAWFEYDEIKYLGKIVCYGS
jgi:hypothetical protein